MDPTTVTHSYRYEYHLQDLLWKLGIEFPADEAFLKIETSHLGDKGVVVVTTHERY
jgi:hypothetical protein